MGAVELPTAEITLNGARAWQVGPRNVLLTPDDATVAMAGRLEHWARELMHAYQAQALREVS